MSMLDLHILLEGEIKVVTPLHVGSGEFEADQQISASGANASNEGPASARVQVDEVGRAYIAGSSLKGALRARSEQLDPKLAQILFGEKKDDDSGTAGALVILGAQIKTAPKASNLPLFKALREGNRKGRAMAARTAVSPKRGTADDKKLFFAEVIVPDVVFSFRARYTPPKDKQVAAATTEALRRLIGAWQTEGIALGRGTADGDGRTELCKLTAKKIAIDCVGGEIKETIDPAFSGRQDRTALPGQTLTLRLTGNGPYFVQDWSHKPKRTADDSEPSDPQLRGQEDHKGGPALPGTSLMGSLRSRAAWLAQISGVNEDVVGELFGTTKAKAKLLVDKIKCTNEGSPVTMTSVKLDRFSAAPIDGALFSTDCVADPWFSVALRLHPSCSAVSRTFLRDTLCADLVRNGLRLGHSGARGFGWFTVTADISNLQGAAR